MRAFAVHISVLSSTLLAGCAIHPLQQDVTGIPTAVLTDHIRCEAKSAVEEKAVEMLMQYGTPSAVALAAELRSNPAEFANFDKRRLDKVERSFYDRYIKTAIAYNFTFDITEDNKAGAQIDLLRPWTGGALSLGLGASGEFSRENQRRFIVSDTFEELLDNEKLDCSQEYRLGNYAYPIAGAIGLREVISSFIDLNEDKKLDFLDKAEVFADTLTFITTVGASAGPKLTFAPAPRGFQVADVPLSGSVSRVDKHSVIIGLSLGSRADDTKRKSNLPLAASVVPGSTILSSATGTATERAIQATFLQRFNTFLDRFSDLLGR